MINAEILLNALENEQEFPKFRCPYCEQSFCSIDNSLKINYNTEKSNQFAYEVGEPTDLEGHFSYKLICRNDNCKEALIVSGRTNVIEDGYDSAFDDSTGEAHDYPVYKIKHKIDFISFPINLISLPKNIDTNIKENLLSAFQLFWIDLNSCGNRLRTVIELFLDKLNIPAGKLHNRIKNLEQESHEYHSFYKILTASRLLGNECTHTYHSVERIDIIKLYTILEHLLSKYYKIDNSTYINIVSDELITKYGVDS